MAPDAAPGRSPTVIAHRGASAAHPPGNTIDAFGAAGPLGATWVELDVRRTADGALAVHHDAELPDGRLIASLPTTGLPAWVPLLDAALDACAGLGVNVEIKNSPDEPDFDESLAVADAVVGLLALRDGGSAFGASAFLVSSFHLATIDRVRAVEPAMATAFLVLEPDERSLRAAAERGHAAVHPWYGLVTPATIELARSLGLAVNVWTVDEPAAIVALAELGVDGVVTNVPDVAVAALSPV
jgi:glycerophosphoryl diester phosphodiesterase